MKVTFATLQALSRREECPERIELGRGRRLRMPAFRRRGSALARAGRAVRPSVEPMEGRTLFAAVSWTGAVSDVWSVAGNWSNGIVPTAADDVTISLSTNTPVRITTGTQSIQSLNSSQPIALSNGTLAVSQTATLTANLTISGGTLSGGTYTFTGASVVGSAGGVIQNASLTSDLVIQPSASLELRGAVRFTTARLQGSNSNLNLQNGFTLEDDVVAEGSGSGTRFVNLAVGGSGTVTLTPTASISLASGTGGALQIRNSSTATLVNNGTITASAAGQTLTVINSTLTNNGLIQAAAGSLTLSSTNYTNTGTLGIASGATLNLDGTFNATGGIGTFSNTGGTVNVGGTISNTGSTIALTSGTGSWNLLGGRIAGGTVTYAGGSSLLTTTSGGTLADVAVAGEILVGVSGVLSVSGTTTFNAVRLQGSNASLNMAPGFLLASPVIADGAASGTRFVNMAVGGSGTVTVNSLGSIRLASGVGGDLQLRNSSIAALSNGGLISADAPGQTLTIVNSTLTNSGTLRATAGTLDIRPTNWTNTSGTIAAAPGGTVNLGGTLDATGGIGTFDNTGGSILVTGTINNTGSTIALNTSTGSFTLAGGAITGGSLTYANGSSLLTSSSGGTLSSLAITGEILVPANASVLLSGSTSFSAARLQGSNASINMAPGFTLSSAVIADGIASGTRFVNLAVGGSGTVSMTSTGSITLGSGAGGDLQIRNSSIATLVSSGVIAAEATGMTLTIVNSTFTNNGTARATAGTLDIRPTNWTNTSGTIAVSPGAAVNLGGTLNATTSIGNFNNTGGTINVTGTITNTGSSIPLNSSTGSFFLLGGAIAGGGITYANGSVLVPTSSSGTLSSVAISGEIVLAANTSVLLTGTTTFTAARLQGSNASLNMAPGFTLSSDVIADGAATGTRFINLAVGGSGTVNFSAAASVTLAADAGGDLQLRNSSTATLVNAGLMSVEATGMTLTIVNSTFTNSGTLRATAGTFDIRPTNWTNTGTVEIGPGGVVNLGGTLGATSGIGTLSNTGGTLNITGTINNTGSTIALTAGTGSLQFLGGQISGGNVTYAGGASLLTTSSGGTLNSVAVGGEILVGANASLSLAGTSTFTRLRLQGSNASVNMAPSYTLNSEIVADGAAAGTRFINLAVGGSGTVNIGASGIIRLATDAGGDLNLRNSSTATLISAGLISVEATGRTLSLTQSNFTNNGTLTALAGTLDIRPTNWSNTSGTINVASGAEVDLGGTLNATAGIGTIVSAGLLQVTGTINNTGNTIALTDTTGPLTFAGGTISGGSVSYAGSASLLVTSSTGLLASVAVLGDILIPANGSLQVSGNTSFVAARLQGSNANLSMSPSYTLNSTVIAEGPSTGTRFITLAVGGSGTVTFGPNAVVRLAADAGGGLQLRNSSTATLINNGLVSGESGTQSLVINQSNMINNGTIQALAGTVDIQPTAWSNTGTLSVTAAATLRLGGTLTATAGIGTLVNTGGTIAVTGTINNTAATITLGASTGTLTFIGGTLGGGSVQFTDGVKLAFTSSGGELEDVAIGGDIDLGADEIILLSGSTTFTAAHLLGSGADIRLAPDYVIQSPIIAEGGVSGTRFVTLALGGSGTVTIAPSGSIVLGATAGGTLQIRNSSTAALVNNGLISSQSIGQVLQIANSTLTNNGTLEAAAGNLTLFATLTNLVTVASVTTLTGGRFVAEDGGLFRFDNGTAIDVLDAEVSVSGAASGIFGDNSGTDSPFSPTLTVAADGLLGLDAGAAMTFAALINLGSVVVGPGSLVAVTGDFSNAGSVTTVIAGTSNTTFGRITVGGTATLAGAYTAPFGAEFEPAAGSSVTPIVAGAVAGTFASFTSGTGTAGGQYSIAYTPTSVVLSRGAPGSPSTPDLLAGSDSGSSNTDNYTNVTTPTVFGTAPVGATVLIFDGTTQVGSGTADSSGNYSIVLSALVDGVHTITATASTGGGTPVPSGGSLTLTIDTVAPSVTPPTVPPTVSADPNGAIVNFAATVNDAGDPNPTIVYSPLLPGNVFPQGTTNETVVATDLAGNFASGTFSVVVSTVTVPPPPPPVSMPVIGGLDPSFGNGTGVVTVVVPNTQLVSLDSFAFVDGRTLTGAYDATTGQLVISRFNIDGSLDTTFGASGFVRSIAPAGFTPRKVQFSPTGNIYMLGTAGGVPAVVRFTADGVSDGSFGAGGILTVPGLAAGDRVDAIAEGVGKIRGFLIGGSALINGVQNAILLNILPDGTVNTRFNKGSVLRPGGEIGTFNSITISPKSVIFVGGVASSGAAADNSLLASGVVLSLSSSGKAAKFGSGGVAVVGVPGFGIVAGQKILLQGDGKVLLSVSIATNASEAAAGRFGRAIVRLTSRGLVDSTFNQIGQVIVDVPPSASAAGIVVLGLSSPRFGTLASSPLSDALDQAQSSLVIVPGGRIREIAAEVSGANTNVVESQIVADAVDLVAGALTVKATKPYRPGARVSGTLSVANVGTLSGTGNVPVQIYFSTDAVLDDSDTAGPVVNARLKLKPGATGRVKLAFTAPTVGGDYFTIAVVNPDASFGELTLDNDTGVSALPFSVLAPATQGLLQLPGERPFFSKTPVSVLL